MSKIKSDGRLRLGWVLETHWGGNQSALARSLRVTPRTVQRWLKGERAVSETALRLAETLVEHGER